MRIQITEWQPPDHPWSDELAVEEWCGICGQTRICHDGNMDRAFDWLERLGRRADGDFGDSDA